LRNHGRLHQLYKRGATSFPPQSRTEKLVTLDDPVRFWRLEFVYLLLGSFFKTGRGLRMFFSNRCRVLMCIDTVS